MDGFQVLCTVFVTIAFYTDSTVADHEYMVTNAESITVPLEFETKLQCVMNIEPDKFQWKFYPLEDKDVYNPQAFISLTKGSYVLIPPNDYTTQRHQSDLTLQADSKRIAGDYQCLAYYGASVVASIPWRITITTLGQFPKQDNIDLTVVAGNTINWRCEPPESNPEAYIDYFKNDKYIQPSSTLQTKSLIIPNVDSSHSGKYRCRAIITTGDFRNASTVFNLRVVKSAQLSPPSFIMPPKKTYSVTRGETVFLECSAVGNPIPHVVWEKIVGPIPKKRADMVEGGLIIKNVSASDDGIYICNQKNTKGSISHQIELVYNEPPSIECFLNTTDVKQRENLDLDCKVTGTPEPQITWFLNGFSVNNDSAIEAIGNRIYFRPVEKRHAGNLQIFARNIVKTVYSSISVKVIPLSTSIDVSVPPTKTHHNRHNNRGNGSRKSQKHTKMIPPSRPNVTRLNDEAVVVRWNVPSNKGLPIQFFKVQYRELGPANQHEHHGRTKGSKWMTTNADIPPHIRSYEVNNLKPDYLYRFRIAAVYSNNDNTISQNSDKFHLRKLDFDKRNPLPVPLLTHTEPINSTTVKIYWKDVPSNITVDGFFVNYNSASSAADYMKATVDGHLTNSYVLSHLQPDTVYDIKLQSFTSKSASEFSSIMKVKTLPGPSTTSSSPKEAITSVPNAETAGVSKLYIIIASGVIGGGGVLVSAIVLLLFCRKWKQKKNNRNDRDKPAVDDHHIQADGNEYVVSPKTLPRSNGCVPSNRITITANPLADADNKNQNMIEMSCLSVQNNNCSTPSSPTSVQPSASNHQDSPPPSNSNQDNISRKKINENKRIRNNKHNVESSSGENYV